MQWLLKAGTQQEHTSPPRSSRKNAVPLTIFRKAFSNIWRRKWQPTPVFLPGKSHGQRSLVGCSPWGCRVRHDWVTNTYLWLIYRSRQMKSVQAPSLWFSVCYTIVSFHNQNGQDFSLLLDSKSSGRQILLYAPVQPQSLRHCQEREVLSSSFM